MKNPGFDLIREFNKGNRRAFTIIYDDCFASVLTVAKKYFSEEDDALDIASESFMTLWQKRNTFNSIDHIKGFLFLTTRNAAINHLKVLQRQNIRAKEWTYWLQQASEEHHKDIEIEAETYELIYRAIEQLPTKCR